MSLRNRHFNLRDKVFMCKITRIKSGGMIMVGDYCSFIQNIESM